MKKLIIFILIFSSSELFAQQTNKDDASVKPKIAEVKEIQKPDVVLPAVVSPAPVLNTEVKPITEGPDIKAMPVKTQSISESKAVTAPVIKPAPPLTGPSKVSTLK